MSIKVANSIELDVIKAKVYDTLPEVYHNQIVFTVDKDTGNSIYYFKEPLESTKHPNYYYIPGFCTYGVNLNGDLINLRSGRLRKWSTHTAPSGSSITGGYKVAPVINDLGRRVGISRHRVKMITFKHPKVDISKYIVNHIDGIPGNDDLSNLEWCTYSQNTKHAYDNNLHPNKVVRIISWNVATGEFKTYNTLEAASLEHGLSPISLRNRTLNKRKHRLYEDLLLFKENDGKPWPIIEDKVYSLDGTSMVVSKNIYDNSIDIYSSTTHAAYEVDMCNTLMGHHIKNGHLDPINDRWFRKLDGPLASVKFPVFEEFDILRYESNIKFKSAYPILTFLATGETKSYLSYQHASEELGISYSHLSCICRGVTHHKEGLFTGVVGKRVLILN